MTIGSLHLVALVATACVMWPNIACDTTSSNYKSPFSSPPIPATDSQIEHYVTGFVSDNFVLTKLMRENMCRKKLNSFVRQLCRPYFRAERRLFCDNLHPFKPLSKSARKNCRKTYNGDSMRRRSIGRVVKTCCAESCSLSTLTKYCRPMASDSPQVPTHFSEDRDAIFNLKLPMFRPPPNYGQYE